MIDLTTLAYPRHLHHLDGHARIVHSAVEAAATFAEEGWGLLPVGAEYPLPGVIELPIATVATMATVSAHVKASKVRR